MIETRIAEPSEAFADRLTERAARVAAARIATARLARRGKPGWRYAQLLWPLFGQD